VSCEEILRFCQEARRRWNLSIELNSKKKGNVGRKSKLTDALKEVYRTIIEEYAYT
jgi:hypothetical protein